tara:strand:+ start:483 stop:710 length:228 start_codon:yes stop_codon:yes gene_type:complete
MSEHKKASSKTKKQNKWIEDTEVELAGSPDLTVDAMIANASDSEMEKIALGENPRRVFGKDDESGDGDEEAEEEE